MNSRPKKCSKLEGSNITAGVVESVEQFLLHSRNPAFLQSCLHLLQASTIQDAKERLSLHTWALVHRCHGLNIPEDVVNRLAILSFLSPDEVSSLRSLRENEVQSASQRPEDCTVNSSEVRILTGSQLPHPPNDDDFAVQLTPPLYQIPGSQVDAQSTRLVESSVHPHNAANRDQILSGTMLETSPLGVFDDNRNDSNSQGYICSVLDLRESNVHETSPSIEECTGDQEEVSMLTPPGSLGVNNAVCRPEVANSLTEEGHNHVIQIDNRDQAEDLDGDGTDVEEFAAISVLLLESEDVQMELPLIAESIDTRACIQFTRVTDTESCTGNKTDDESIEVSSMYEACSSQDTTDEQIVVLNETFDSGSWNDREIMQDPHQLVSRSESGAIPKRRNNTRIAHSLVDKLIFSKSSETKSQSNVRRKEFHSQSKRSKLSSSDYSHFSSYDQCRIPQQHERETSSSANPYCVGPYKKGIIEDTSAGFSCLLSQIDVATSALIAGLDRDANNMIDDAIRSLSQTLGSRDLPQGPHSSNLDEFLENRPNNNSSSAILRASGTYNSAVNIKDVTTSHLENEKKITREVPKERMQNDLFEPNRSDRANESLPKSAKESKNSANNSKCIVDTDDTGSDYSLSDFDDDASLGTMSDCDTTDVALSNICRMDDGGPTVQDETLDGSAGSDVEERSITSFGSETGCQDDTFSSLEHLSCACPLDDLIETKSHIFAPECKVLGQQHCDQSTLECDSSSEANNDDAHERNSSIRAQKPEDPSTLLKFPLGNSAEEDASRWGLVDDEASSIQSESLLKNYYNNA